MASQGFTSSNRPIHTQHAALTDLTALRPPLSIQNTDHLAITKVSSGKGTYDLLVTTKGRTPRSATIAFEKISRGDALSLLRVLTANSSNPAATRDPVRSVTLLTTAIDYANAKDLSAHAPTGQSGHDDLARFFDTEIATLSHTDLIGLVDRREIARGIYHLAFPNQFMMNAAFLRPQEYYESPKFRGKVFTTTEFREWYKTTRPHKEFSYYTDWSGFNLPQEAIRPFIRGAFGDLSPLEKIIIEPFRGLKGPIYIIGTLQGDTYSTLRHEIAHALYHTNSAYKEEVERVLKTVTLNPIFRYLKGMGYHHLRWKDEAHAYLGDAPAELDLLGIPSCLYTDPHKQLLRIYNKHSPIKHSW
jgi:hypothetical protein